MLIFAKVYLGLEVVVEGLGCEDVGMVLERGGYFTVLVGSPLVLRLANVYLDLAAVVKVVNGKAVATVGRGVVVLALCHHDNVVVISGTGDVI